MLHGERLDYVADLDVLIVLQHYAAIEVLSHFLDVVLTVTQRRDFGSDFDRAVADKSGFCAAHDFAVDDVATRNDSDTRNFEQFSDFGTAEDNLFEFGFEQTFDGFFDVLDGVVNDVVETNVDFFCAASAFALASGRTLKPMMIAFAVSASVTSLSLIAPTAP